MTMEMGKGMSSKGASAATKAAMKSMPGKNSGIGAVKGLAASKAPRSPFGDEKRSSKRNGPRQSNGSGK